MNADGGSCTLTIGMEARHAAVEHHVRKGPTRICTEEMAGLQAAAFLLGYRTTAGDGVTTLLSPLEKARHFVLETTAPAFDPSGTRTQLCGLKARHLNF